VTALLLDLGNTALKWATYDKPEEPHAYMHCGNDVVPDELLHSWLNLKPARVVGCMVSSEKFAFNITRFFNSQNIKWDWLHSEREFRSPSLTIVNRYDNYEQLGSDRWHAVIGAASLYPGEPIVVVHIGTATTVDVVVPEGDGVQAFLGGRILPGPSMMNEALLTKTRCRPGRIGVRADFPSNTADAIATAVLEAHLGLVDRTLTALGRMGFESPRMLFAGGAAPLFTPYLMQEYPQAVIKHNLVLRGLAMRAKVR
jgi:type III pantothenate kinase